MYLGNYIQALPMDIVIGEKSKLKFLEEFLVGLHYVFVFCVTF